MAHDPLNHARPRPDQAVYSISVVAELVDTAPQNLRVYEARGLVVPSRTSGGTRRYSDDDVTRIRRIGELLNAGLNLAGVKLVLEMELETERLRGELDDARARLRRHAQPEDGA
jgi:MerR family transcriptional regulator/heat shock protein HspR